MNEADESDQSYIRVEQQLPELHQRVIVISKKSRRYGYLDELGIWRSHYSGEEITDVIGWAP